MSVDWYQLERGRYKESVLEDDCGGNIMYKCMKMEKRDLSKGRKDKGE
jgi:hypothetical protein